MSALDVDQINFAKGGGLVPAIVQDAVTRQVLMLAYMDRAALEETVTSGEATFFSRARGGRWRKGETSGNRLRVVSIESDCDNDAVLVSASPAGPTCHLGTSSCFGDTAPTDGHVLHSLERTIAARSGAPSEQSYTARLLGEGTKRVSQKVGEEGVECALAGVAGSDQDLCEESADLLYHLLVLLHARGLALADVLGVLARRAKAKP